MVPDIKMRGGFAAGITQLPGGAVMDRPFGHPKAERALLMYWWFYSVSPNLMARSIRINAAVK